MSIKNQQEVKSKAYAEAMRYMENAKETLQKARKDNNRYHDVKYVRTACGTAYSGVLLALDAYLQLKDVELPKKNRRSISFYTSHVAQLDRKLLDDVNNAYDILHLSGYYDGVGDARVIKIGFEYAYRIIDKIKPQPDSPQLANHPNRPAQPIFPGALLIPSLMLWIAGFLRLAVTPRSA
jgi:hypothetical protein